MTIYTIGHSTHPDEEFAGILEHYGIEQLVDIRTVPRSRHTPQFNMDTLPSFLADYGITYTHIAQLGGLRKTRQDSSNTGWRNLSFRGYADYMQTIDFEHGLDQLITLAERKTTAIMCAEVLPWRCHRSLVGDALIVRDIKVIDIFGLDKADTEQLTTFARVSGTTITYPPAD